MTRTVMYRYMGTNGIIESPVHLEDIYYIRFIKLMADADKVLTNGKDRVKAVSTTEEEEHLWKEVKA